MSEEKTKHSSIYLLPPALRVVLSQLSRAEVRVTPWARGQSVTGPPRKTYNLHQLTNSQVSQSRHPFWLCHVLVNMVASQISDTRTTCRCLFPSSTCCFVLFSVKVSKPPSTDSSKRTPEVIVELKSRNISI